MSYPKPSPTQIAQFENWVRKFYNDPDIRVREQNMAKHSRTANTLREMNLPAWAVLWAYNAKKYPHVIYYGFFGIRGVVDPDTVHALRMDLHVPGKKSIYDFWGIPRKEG